MRIRLLDHSSSTFVCPPTGPGAAPSPSVVRRADEQQVVWSPDRRADVAAARSAVRMAPEQVTIIRVESHHVIGKRGDQLS